MEFSKEYLKKLYEQLDVLKPDDSINLKKIKHADQRNKYIAAVKVYIDDNHNEIEFNNDYTKVKKLCLSKAWA